MKKVNRNKNRNKMIALPNGCRASKLSVFPKNWETRKAPVNVEWYISYRFYDPAHPKPKQVLLRGMNREKTHSERKRMTAGLIENELQRLYEGFNPFMGEVVRAAEVDPDTPIFEALKWVAGKITVSERTAKDIKYCLKWIQNPRYSAIPVKEVKRSHIKSILEDCSKSADQFNKNRSYLMILFGELIEREVIDLNPVLQVKKKKTVRKIRRVLTTEERKKVAEHLKSYPSFYRFLQIFFHSGARISEMVQIKGRDVDLKRQVFKVTLKKGKEFREVEKVIKDVALPYWKELKPGPNDFVFSKGLEPGPKSIKPYQITKRWYRLVKQKIGIEADFYSLKHSNTDETSAALSLKDAASHNSHTTPVITLRYAVTETERQQEKLKKVDNKF